MPDERMDRGAKIVKIPLLGCPSCGEKVEPIHECPDCGRPQCQACYKEEGKCPMCTYLDEQYPEKDSIEDVWKTDAGDLFSNKWAKEDDYALEDTDPDPGKQRD